MLAYLNTIKPITNSNCSLFLTMPSTQDLTYGFVWELMRFFGGMAIKNNYRPPTKIYVII